MQMNVRFLGPTSVRMGSVQISFLRILATVAPASSTITSGLSVWVRKSFSYYLLCMVYELMYGRIRGLLCITMLMC